MQYCKSPTCRLVMVVAVVFLVGGCQKTGRISTSRTTPAETKSQRVLPVALSEFTEQVTLQLVGELHDDPLIAQTTTPVTVILGDILNKTNIVSSNDFEYVSKRIRSDLINSSAARRRLKFVERRARMLDLADREKIGTVAAPVDPEPYDPETTYTLNGDFYRIDRGDTNFYYMEFQLVRFHGNEIVFSSRSEVKQISGR
jgi:hypothetical protein